MSNANTRQVVCDRLSDMEAVWKLAERDMIRRERVKRIHNGTIVPAARGLPNVMARDANGKWWPNSNFVGGS